MDGEYIRRIVALLSLLLFLSGCTTWNKLVDRNQRKTPYDDFAEMSNAEIDAFNADPANKNNKIICKWEAPTGSHISERTCYWEEEIRRRSLMDQKAISDMQGGGGGGGY